ncbi:hypothetical protein JQX13_45965 [Archangium violaceum]|uniref:hypothetical protein n=1 Tax=Archangium violaceum TaxID=83451 RepID=UPI00193AF8E6|nr:hypothetical protein [Archangium violaceum]QRK07312.1 hypothetical protein JQX13_45965 [Archangium violaceum]
MTPNIHFKDRVIEGERVELPKHAIYWLGPNVTFRNCTVVISVASRGLVPMSGRFIDCTIQAKGELKNVRWAPMHFRGCRFKGRFAGNDFGFREDDIDKWKIGGIEDCDFSEARLDGCRFFNCDMKTIRLPLWPCFTFMDARRHAAELGRHEWPGSFDSVIKVVCDAPEGTVASTWHAHTAAENMGTTAEELRAALEKVPWVVM